MFYLKNLFKTVFLICVSLAFESLSAQQKYEYSYRQVTLLDGLSQSSGLSIIQDSLGFIWIGTEEGLNRYDGYTITTYLYEVNDTTSVSNSYIFDLHLDSKKRLWVATYNGLNLYDYKSDSFKRILTDSVSQSVLKSTYFNKLASDDENLYIGSSNGLYRLNFETMMLSLIDVSKELYPDYHPYVAAFYPQKNKGVWFSDYVNGIYYYDLEKDSISAYTESNLPKGFNYVSITAITSGFNEDLIVSDNTRGILRYDLLEDRYESLFDPITDDPAKLYNYAKEFTRTGNIIYAATSDGVVRIEWAGSRYITSLVEDDGYFKQDVAYSIFLDKTNNLWVGSSFNGVFIYDLKPKKFNTVTYNRKTELGLSNPMVWSIYDDGGKVYVATQNGLNVADRDEFDFKKMKSNNQEMTGYSLSGSEISKITGNKDKLWIAASYSALNEYDKNKGTYTYYNSRNNDAFLNNAINNAFYDDRGYVWTSTMNGGLIRMKISDNTFKNYRKDAEDKLSIASDNIWVISKSSDGTIWIGTDKGISAYSLESDSFTNIELSEADGFGGNDKNVYDIFEDSKGRIWLTSAFGLHLYNRELGKVELVLHSGDNNKSSINYNVLEDDNNHLWVSTNNGLLRYRDNEEGTFEQNHFNIYNGLPSNEFNSGAHFKAKDGRIYFGSVNGFTWFYPDSVILNPFIPNVIISKAEVVKQGKRILYPLYNSKNLTLNYDDNVIFFDFASLDFTEPKANQYKYRLVNFDNEWIKSDVKPSLIYTNLSPGTYYLEIMGSNSDGIWNPEPARVKLVIIPPFYQTRVFYIVSLIFLVLALIGGVKYREANLKRRNELLNQEVEKQTSEIKRSEAIFRQISDNAAELITLLNLESKIIYASPSHKPLMGYNSEELIGKKVSELVHPDDADLTKEEFRRLWKEGILTFSEYRVRHKNGTWKTLQTSGSVILSDKGEPESMVMVSHDISRMIRIQEYLIESRNEAQHANKAKSAFLAGISHELRTPLNAIIGFAQILRKEPNLNPRQKKYTETMYKSGIHLLEMINDVLDISKIEADKMSLNYDNFSLSTLLNDIYGIFELESQNKSIHFSLDIDKEIEEFVYSDAGKVRQILINLIGNAIKFTIRGGVNIFVRIIDEPLDYSTLETSWKESISEEPRHLSIAFEVKDSGKGIPKESLDSIFEPFQQLNDDTNFNQGTGLGLAISSKLVAMLGGGIQADSEPGFGSTFTVKLPFLKADKPSMIIQKEMTNQLFLPDNLNYTILLVDDIDYNLTLLKEILEPVGFICATATNGKEAIEVVKTINPHLILMDLKMPVMSGEQALIEIRKRGIKTKAIAITASGFDDTKNEMLKLGFDDFIHKPFMDYDLLRIIGKLLNIEYVEKDVSDIQDESYEGNLNRELEHLNIDFKKQLEDAVDTMDWEELQKLNAKLADEYHYLHTYLRKAIIEQQHMLLVKLGEKLN